MKFYNGNHFVVRFKNGDLWHFFSQKGGGIYFRSLTKNSIWSEPCELLYDAMEEFSLCIDDDDFVHLISHTSQGEIRYMRYNGKTWSKQILSRYEPARYVIRFPSIAVVKNHIHIIFAIGTTFNIGLWSLYHYCWNGDKWGHQEICKFTAGRHISPFHYDIHNGNIHVVYRGMSTTNYQIYHCTYSSDHSKWSSPENITYSKSDCSMPCILVKENRLHVVWTSVHKANLVVKYRNKDLDLYRKHPWGDEILLSEEGSNASYPQLIWADNKLYCIWYQKDNLYTCCSSNNGDSWDKNETLDWPHSEPVCILYYSTNHPLERSTIKARRVFAKIGEKITIPIIDTHMYSHSSINPSSNTVKDPVMPSTADLVSDSTNGTENTDSETTEKKQNEKAVREKSKSVDNPDHASITKPAGISEDIISYIKVLLNEIERIENLKGNLENLLKDNSMEKQAPPPSAELENRLDFWIRNVEETYEKHLEIIKEIEEIRKNCLENKRKWELLLEELDDIKNEVDRLKEKSFLKRILKSFRM